MLDESDDTALSASWSGHCQQVPSVHFYGTESEVDDWLAYKRSDSLVRKLGGFTFVKSRPGCFRYTHWGTDDEEDEVSGDAAYIMGPEFPRYEQPYEEPWISLLAP